MIRIFSQTANNMQGDVSIRDHSWSCENCHQIFQTRVLPSIHAVDTSHMSNRLCEPCQSLYQNPHFQEQHQQVSPQRAHLSFSTHAQVTQPEQRRGKTESSGQARGRHHHQSSRRVGQHRSPHAWAAESSDQNRSSIDAPVASGSRVAVPTNAIDIKKRVPNATVAKDTPRQSKPLVFLDPPEYPAIHCQAVGSKQYGNNQYTLFAPSDQAALFQALQLRCLSERRLKQKKFLTSENFSCWPEFRLPGGINVGDVLMTPKPSIRHTRRAVAIDCEMVSVGSGVFEGGKEKERNELAQLCAIDVLTGEVLIDKLVLPRERVLNWNTRYSGVSYPKIIAARENRRLLRGWQAARTELMNFIDADTIVVGHALENDLHILRVAHDKIVDTSIQTAEAVYGNTETYFRTWSLKELAKSLTDSSIQTDKRKGHDCVEDTLATREIALWCICHPRELGEWAAQMRLELENKRIEREEKLEWERKKYETEQAMQATEEKQEYVNQGWSQVSLPSLDVTISQDAFNNTQQLDTR